MQPPWGFLSPRLINQYFNGGDELCHSFFGLHGAWTQTSIANFYSNQDVEEACHHLQQESMEAKKRSDPITHCKKRPETQNWKGIFPACNFSPSNWPHHNIKQTQPFPAPRHESRAFTLWLQSWKLPPGNPFGAHHATYSLSLFCFWIRAPGGTLPLCQFNLTIKVSGVVKFQAPVNFKICARGVPY